MGAARALEELRASDANPSEVLSDTDVGRVLQNLDEYETALRARHLGAYVRSGG